MLHIPVNSRMQLKALVTIFLTGGRDSYIYCTEPYLNNVYMLNYVQDIHFKANIFIISLFVAEHIMLI
jgi:hypothetical protein